VRTLRRFPLNTNLTKWLSKCEGSLQKDKEKNTRAKIKEHKMKQGMKNMTEWKKTHNIMKKVKGEMERNEKDDMKKAYGEWGR